MRDDGVVRERESGRQVRPATEGWQQRLGADGRPLLQFASPKRGMPPRHLADVPAPEWGAVAQELGVPTFRVKQVARHYFARHTDDPATMTDLGGADRDRLVPALLPPLLTEIQRRTTDKGDTAKLLYRLHDGALIESVLMRYPGRITLCVSSQAGCGMNCPFCATGQAGLTRNLSAAEIVDQVIRAQRMLADENARVSNIVFMGMGEPLANYARLLSAVCTLVAPPPEGLGMSARHITVSTVGLVPAIHKLAAEGLPLTCALSLHAPDDELRDELIPVNARWKVDEALDAVRGYFDTTGRRISIEYALIRDMNDHPWRADLLAEKLLARGRGWVHVNPIPLNPTPGSIWTASTLAIQREFVRRLESAGIPTTLRDTRGRDIDGACGQLAAAHTTPAT